MSEMIGICFIALGIGALFATWLEYRRLPRGSGITTELAELLRTPAYVLRAKAYCRAYGYPESEWKRFADRAFAEVVTKGFR
jgi:hypothetical protein